MKKFLREFKDFAAKGNVLDLAVAVIIGGAFGKIVSSLVADIITPALGLIYGGRDFRTWKLSLGAAEIGIGAFLQNLLDFLIFLLVKAVAALKRPAAATPVVSAAPNKEQELLSEIRDILKSKQA
jgi:large conductance mechanosensitive channel